MEIVDSDTELLGIKTPDLNNLEPWLDEYITKPLTGFEDKTHPDGKLFSAEEATEASRDQLRILAKDRQGVVEYKNKLRAAKGATLLSQEQFDQDMIEDFMAIALDLNSR